MGDLVLVLSIITILSIVQSIFGVGVLLFGTPIFLLMGYDFSIAVDERDNDEALQIIEKIEKLPTIWRDEI